MRTLNLKGIRIEWNSDKIIEQVTNRVFIASEYGADLVYKAAMRKVSVGKTGKLSGAIEKAKSEFKNGGWIVGVFFQGGDWVKSLAARAIFVEYGHAGPGMGKGTEKGHRSGYRKWEAGKKVTTPQPFLKNSLIENEVRIIQKYRELLGK